MAKSVFISYRDSQRDWVASRLVPVLEAGGATVLVDYREFRSSRQVIGQMDELQDRADVNLLLLTRDYLESGYCRHEMERAVDRDPRFKDGIVLPIKLENTHLPEALGGASEPDYVDLQDDSIPGQWRLLMDICDARLGIDVPDWLRARDRIVAEMTASGLVNLVVSGKYIAWRELLEHLQRDLLPEMGVVNLSVGVHSRKELIAELLRAAGTPAHVPGPPHDLTVMDVKLRRRKLSQIALKNLEPALENSWFREQTELFMELRKLLNHGGKLGLLIITTKPLNEILPAEHPLTGYEEITTIELRGSELIWNDGT